MSEMSEMSETVYRVCRVCGGRGYAEASGDDAGDTLIGPCVDCQGRGFVPAIRDLIANALIAYDFAPSPHTLADLGGKLKDAYLGRADAVLAVIVSAAPDDGDEALLRRALAGGFRVLFWAHGDRVGCTLRAPGSAADPAWRWYDGEGGDPASALAEALGNAEAR